MMNNYLELIFCFMIFGGVIYLAYLNIKTSSDIEELLSSKYSSFYEYSPGIEYSPKFDRYRCKVTKKFIRKPDIVRGVEIIREALKSSGISSDKLANMDS